MFGRGNYGNFGNFRNNGFDGCLGFGYNNWWTMLIAGIIIVFVVVILFMVFQKNKVKSVKSSALETLKIKYVQGEITEEEYIRRKDILSRD
jgi:putative membrane protein